MIPFLIILFGTVLIGWSLEQGRTISFSGIIRSFFTGAYWRGFWEDRNRNNDNLFFTKSFLFGFLFLILFAARLVFDDSLPPNKLTENGIAHLNNFSFVIFITGIILLIHGIIHSRPTQKIPSLFLVGTGLLYLGSLWIFRPRPFNYFFQHILLITTADLFAVLAAFLLGFGFYLAYQHSNLSLPAFLHSLIPQASTGSPVKLKAPTAGQPGHSQHRGFLLIFIIGSGAIALLIIMQSLSPSLIDRISSFKTPWFEAQIKPLDHKIGDKLLQNWDQESLVPLSLLKGNITALKDHEEIIKKNTDSPYYVSLKKLEELLEESGYYDFLNHIYTSGILGRPSLPVIKNEVLCWEKTLRLITKDKKCLKEKDISINFDHLELAKNNAVYSILLANIASVNLDRRKAIAILEKSLADLENSIADDIDDNVSPKGLPLIKTWIGYISFTTYPKDVKESILSATVFWEDALIDIHNLMNDLGKEKKSEKVENTIEFWKRFQTQVKHYLAYVYAEALIHEFSARKHAQDLHDALNQKPWLKFEHPEWLDTVGWVKIQFYKDKDEVREAQLIFTELEDLIQGWDVDKLKKWNFLKIVRFHMSKANKILGQNNFS